MTRIFLFISIFTLIVSCNNTSYKDNQKNDSELRIVSLAPSISKQLENLDLTKKIVGATTYCDISENNKELIIGSAMEVNLEKILLLKPDIVLATGLTKDNTVQALENNGIKVHRFGKMESFDSICTQFLVLGKLVDKSDLAKTIVSKTKLKVDSLINTIPDKEKKEKVFFQIGAKPIFTVIPNTFMNDYITLAKCDNIASDLDKGTMTRESVLNRNPDVIFIVTMGIVGDEEKDIWDAYKDLNASKNQKIFIIDSRVACTPTVLSFIATLEEVINHIYN